MKRRFGWVVLREQTSGGTLARVLGSPPIQYALLCADSLYDLTRYLRFFTPLRARTRQRRKIEALLSVYYHKIEKTLALPVLPQSFGIASASRLLDLCGSWERSVGDLDAIPFRAACRALRGYRALMRDRLARDSPRVLRGIDDLLARCPDPGDDGHGDGTRGMTADAFMSEARRVDFEGFAQLRHSVRSFATDPVPDDAIMRAVRIAQRTPSVCNRQAWKVHVFTSPQDKETVLRTQNGNSGFGHLAARVLLVSCDSRVYVTSGERHQAYVDGGMFAMTLVYALQSDGIASCCLNLCSYFFQDVAVHRACRIPSWEFPIMMIAIGYPAPAFRVAASARLDADSVVAWHAP